MTLNAVITRIKYLTLAHKQLRNFYYGNVSDFLTEKTTRYASCFLEDTGIVIDKSTKTRQINFQMYLLDVVHVATDAKDNEQDVQSDMLSIAEDIIAQMDFSRYDDWKISGAVTGNFVREALDDLVAGVVLQMTVAVPYNADVCAVPSEETLINEDMKLVYDVEYIADGTEGSTITVPAIVGKKVLLLIRENAPQYKVSANPTSTEYTWNFETIGLGTPAEPNERFLFLYRTL